MHRVLLAFLLFFPFYSFSQMASIELVVKPVPVPSVRNMAVDKWNLLQPGFKTLTPEAQEFLYWVNYCRLEPQKFWDSVLVPVAKVFPALSGAEARSLREDLIKTGPLPMFRLNPRLVNTAQSHADDIAGSRTAPGHTSTNGTDFSTRMRNAGIKNCANENIAVSSQHVLLSVLLLYLDIGLPERGHRKALLNPNLVMVGVGTAPLGKDQHFIVQDLACLQ